MKPLSDLSQPTGQVATVATVATGAAGAAGACRIPAVRRPGVRPGSALLGLLEVGAVGVSTVRAERLLRNAFEVGMRKEDEFAIGGLLLLVRLVVMFPVGRSRTTRRRRRMKRRLR